jgi:peptide/nickel transport system substrate-binding protein
LVAAMPAIQMFGTTQFVPVNTYYWTGEPSAVNPYEGPWWWWSTFKFMLPRFRQTGRR